MIQPYLTSSNWTYTSVDGLIWLTSGLSSPTNLNQKACDKITDIYRTINIEQPLIIDFRNIRDVADRALEKMFQTFEAENREVILISYEMIDSFIDKAINEYYSKPSQSQRTEPGLCYKVLNSTGLSGEHIQEEVRALRKRKVSDYIKHCFVPYDKPKYLHSTPILASGTFDASILISAQTPFFWICLELAEELRTLIAGYKVSLRKELRILSVNLRSAPFASVISLLLSIPLTIIDHLGPKHKVYDLDILDGLEHLKQYSYVYVGDFCIGGTEIKIAQTYAGLSNSELNTALVIGSYFKSEVFSASFDLHSLVEIKDIHSQAKFTLN